MITASHTQISEILKTLPIGLYLGDRTPVVYEETGDSYANLMDGTIHVSGETVMHGLAHLPSDTDPYEFENAIRAILYHELSHIIMTPKTLKNDSEKIINCFEDERIETLLSKYYLGVDFKKMCLAVNGWTKDWKPTDARTYFYGICRFRQGPAKFVRRVAELIHKWKSLRADANEYRAEDYRDDIMRFWNEVRNDWNQNKQQRQDEQEQRNQERNQREQQQKQDKQNQKGNQGQQGQQGGSNGQSGEQNDQQQGGGQSGKDGKQNDKGGKNANGGKGGKDKQNESSDDKDKNGGGSGKDGDEKKDGKDSGNGSEGGSDGDEQDGQNNGGGNSNGGQDGEDGEDGDDSSNGGNSSEGDEGDQDGNQNDSDGDSDGQEENEGDQNDQSEGNNGGEGTDGDEDADADDQNGQSGHGKSSKNRGKNAKEQKRGKGDQGNQVNQVNESTDKDSDKEEEGNGGSAGAAAEEDEDVAEEEINGRVGADNKNEIDEITRESIARDVKRILGKFHDEKVGRVLERLIIQHNKKRMLRTPMSRGYTGKVGYKDVAVRHDYRWFTRKGVGGENMYGSTHFTLWVDCSGSFCEEIGRINSVVHELNELARRIGREFSFDVVQMTMKNRVVSTKAELTSGGCNGFGPGVEECIRKTRKTGCNNYNVVVWDGDMFSGFCRNERERYLPVLRKAFNNQNTVIVTDGDNESYTRNYTPNARVKVIHDRYSVHFVDALLELLAQVLV